MERFFESEPKANYTESNRQTEISTDYRLCYEAMGSGKEKDRDYLAKKYNRQIRTVGDLGKLGSELFGQMDADRRAYDLYHLERIMA